ncbi:hypothetical protein I4U23_027326 [Adineta vaga]|nr:hypothetical protein I4U23_027326 [Adineta vaga]
MPETNQYIQTEATQEQHYLHPLPLIHYKKETQIGNNHQSLPINQSTLRQPTTHNYDLPSSPLYYECL